MTNFDAQFWSISQIENLNKSLFEDTTKDTKQHLTTWQKRFAVSSKILEISEGYENFTDDEKTRAVEELKFLFNTTHPNSFMPEVKSALSKNYADIRNHNEISDGQYWDKVREYGYGTVAIGLTLTTLSPVAIALVGMGLLTTAAMDDVLIDDPDYETADTILKAVYFNTLVQSHESLTKIPQLQSRLSAQIQGQELDIGSVGKGAESIKSPKLKKLAEKIEEAKNNKNGATEVLTSDQLKDAMNTKELSSALAAELKRLEEKREKEHQKAKEEEIKRRRERGERRAAVHLISVTLDKVFDDPEAASFVSASFEAYEKIDKAISLFSASPPAIGPAALTSTLVSVALEVTGIFKKAGPSPEQVILESLQAVHQSLGEIKKMIRDLATHLDKRLDDISKRQAKILNVLISGIDDIIQSQEVGFSELQASITRLQVNLRLFQEKVADDRIRQERTKLHAELQKLSTMSTKAENLNEEDIRETERALEFFLNYATPPYNWLTNPLLAGTQLSSWDDRAVQQLVSSSNRDDVFSALSLAHLVPNKFGAGGHSSIPHPRLWITYVLPLLDAISEFPEIADNVVHQRDLKTISDEAERISNTLTQCTSLEVGKTAALKFSDALDKMMSEILKDAQKETIPNGVTIFPVNTEVHRGMQDTQSEQVGFLQQELPKFGPINRSVERTHVNENKMEQLSKEPYSFGAQNALFSYADQLPETIVSTSKVRHVENDPGSPFVSYLHRIDKVAVNSRAVFNLDYNPLQWSEKHGLIKITKLSQREIDKKSGKRGSAFFNMKEGAGHEASRADYIVVRTLFTPVELTFTEQCSHSVAGKSLAGGELGEIQVVADCYDGDKKHEPKHLKLTPAFWGVLSSGDITVGPVVIKNASDLFSLINHELNRQQIKLRGAFHDYVRESFNGGRGPKYDDFIAEWEAVAGALMGATRVRALLAGADSSQAEAKGDTSILEYLPIFTRSGPNGETSLWQLIELFLSETFSNQNLNDMITNNVDYSDHIQHVISSKLSSFPDTESLLSSFFQACWGNSGTPTTPAQITSFKILIDSISTLDLATLRG